jgi:hypothetical protein
VRACFWLPPVTKTTSCCGLHSHINKSVTKGSASRDQVRGGENVWCRWKWWLGRAASSLGTGAGGDVPKPYPTRAPRVPSPAVAERQRVLQHRCGVRGHGHHAQRPGSWTDIPRSKHPPTSILNLPTGRPCPGLLGMLLSLFFCVSILHCLM